MTCFDHNFFFSLLLLRKTAYPLGGRILRILSRRSRHFWKLKTKKTKNFVLIDRFEIFWKNFALSYFYVLWEKMNIVACRQREEAQKEWTTPTGVRRPLERVACWVRKRQVAAVRLFFISVHNRLNDHADETRSSPPGFCFWICKKKNKQRDCRLTSNFLFVFFVFK